MKAGERTQKTRWSVVSKYRAPNESPGFRLWQGFMNWQRQLNAYLKQFGLTQPQFAILAVCGWMTRDDRLIVQHDVVSFTGMDRMHISQIVSRLERDGLLERQPSMDDHRSKIVKLTASGSDKLARVLPGVEKFDLEFFEHREDRFAQIL